MQREPDRIPAFLVTIWVVGGLFWLAVMVCIVAATGHYCGWW